jgi:dihydropteroate synthase
MEHLVIQISGSGALTLTLGGLTPVQAAALRSHIQASTLGAGLRPALVVSAGTKGDAAGSSGTAVLSGTSDQLKQTIGLIASPCGMSAGFSEKIHLLLDNYLRSDYKIDCRGKILDLRSRTHVMGILNVTPDSFSDGGRYDAQDRALARAREMAAAGADIIDIGGESTRPGAAPVPEDEELRRIIPLIERLSAELPVPLSVDTYKSSVAEKALEAGAAIINDISGLRFSPDMARIAADHGAPLVIMHIKGTPRNMQQNPVYSDVVGEIMTYLEEGIELAIKAGVDREKIVIDPGIGFGKNLEHNLMLINRLDEFKSLGRPILLGTSRKKFIGTVLDIPVPDQRVDGTAATVALGIAKGAGIVRVHDVDRMVHVARMTDAIVKANLKHEVANFK